MKGNIEQWLGSIDAALDALITKSGATCAYCDAPAKTWCYECGALICEQHTEYDGVCVMERQHESDN